MKFTIDWLNEYVDTGGVTPAELADHLTMLGLEVDAVIEIFQDLAPIKTALVVSVERHPDADSLSLCQVAVGPETLQIVCGAPNVRAGLVAAIALPGTTLPGGIKIKKSKVRGIESFGMLCSERELGLSTGHSGIMELPADIPHGQSFIEALGLNDTLVEVDLTPNRPDCASVIGIAREVAGVIGRPLTLPVESVEAQPSTAAFSVDIESSELCPRYGARLITGVTIAPSPWWLRKRLLSIGMRPINNVVDVTNLVMMEYGQPLHAFDFDKLADKKIFVRHPRKNETDFTTLDGVVRKLDADMLMICDGEQPVAVAGIMGGMNSEVSDSTTTILLESACFDPISIRKTARKLNLASEASYRFERGVDPGGCLLAMERAVRLLCNVAGGTAEPGGVDKYFGQKPFNTLTLRIKRTSDLLGIPLDYEIIEKALTSIGFRCKQKEIDSLWVGAPSFRVDIEREVDLVEEVARLIGYNTIPTTLPTVQLRYPERDTSRTIRAEIGTVLTGIGYFEAINYSFSAEKHLQWLGLAEDDPRCRFVRLINPLNEEQSVMRTMLLPGLLENVQRNINFQKGAIKLFEIGKVFTPTGDNEQPLEKTRCAGVLSGNRFGESSHYHFTEQDVDILDAKGAVECLLQELRFLGVGVLAPLSFVLPDQGRMESFTDPLQFLVIKAGEQEVGYLARIMPGVLRKFGIKQDVFFFDLDLEALCQLRSVAKNFTSLPVFPAVNRDIAILVPEHVAAGEMVNAVLQAREPLIEQCEIFDVYQGSTIQQGYKSVALSVTYRSAQKTLTEKNVEKVHVKIVNMLGSKFEGTLREG
ncbi:MAG: phenylalanine--tRNA ligase subunit beta [Desulfocapsaceae bacterium]|nr:phenylalanine--tRNA ligase subunit beta [Desulfocapsaceae bacterium]